jgi:hypothetical protein
MCHFTHLCHQCPGLDLCLWHWMGKFKSGLEASGTSTPLTSLSPVDSIPTPSPPALTLHPPLDQEHLISLCEESQSPVYYDRESHL